MQPCVGAGVFQHLVAGICARDTPLRCEGLHSHDVIASVHRDGDTGDTTDPGQICRAIDQFTDARNEHPVPFEWTKSVVHPGGLKQRYADS